jgi:phytoene synthase
MNDTAEVAALVRAGDRDRYLASLFAPDDMRPHLHALYAFNVELARIRRVVSDPAIGEIRLQWWIDSLPAIHAGKPPDHPVALALAAAIRHGRLPLTALVNLAETRRFDLYDNPMPNIVDLEGYLGETTCALIHLGALILAPARAQESAEAAGLAGVAMGIADVLRALPLHRARGQCYLPREMLEHHGATTQDILSGRWTEGVAAAIAQLLRHGRKRLAEARVLAPALARELYPAFLRASLVELHLDRLEAAGNAILRQDIEVSQLRRQYTLWRSARRLRF